VTASSSLSTRFASMPTRHGSSRRVPLDLRTLGLRGARLGETNAHHRNPLLPEPRTSTYPTVRPLRLRSDPDIAHTGATMKHTPRLAPALGIGLLSATLLAACSDNNGSASSDSSSSDRSSPSSSQSASASPTGQEVKTAQGDLGTFLVDKDGKAVYLFTKDSPGKSVCEGDCLAAWPAVTGKVTAGAGVDASKIGTLKRSDGTTQASYGGWPLYYWVKDKKPGDTTGQGVGGVWYLLNPQGKAIESAGQVATGTSAQLGKFVTDSRGMTLYMFTKDSPGKSVCEGDCLAAWPAVTGEVTAGEGVDASKIGTIKRSDGSTQATFGGWPLYYWVKDKKPGDTTGQGVGGVWYVLSPQGQVIKKGGATG
jgi:predicted lipoprotein with Yx(FWY)xxD motif